MENKTIGFIGFGNMAKAIIKSLNKSSLIDNNKIIVSRIDEKLYEEVSSEYKITPSNSNIEAARESDYLFLSVSPNIYLDIIEEIRDFIKPNCIVISIGAGISSSFLEANLNKDSKYIKIMPNTPAMVGEGMTAMSLNDSLDQKDIEELILLFRTFGKTEIIEENLMDGFTAVAGSSPAYIYMLIEAMADGAVKLGIKREQAYKMAAQSVLGSAKMVLDSGKHPGELKDNVCSPGGTTIAAVSSLEENGFRNSIIKAMEECAKKSMDMNKR